VFRRGPLYAISALLAAGITVASVRAGIYGLPVALAAALACFTLRMLSVRYNISAPVPPETARNAQPGAPPPSQVEGSDHARG
jgi:uncharacterized membrane protein YeiH